MLFSRIRYFIQFINFDGYSSNHLNNFRILTTHLPITNICPNQRRNYSKINPWDSYDATCMEIAFYSHAYTPYFLMQMKTTKVIKQIIYKPFPRTEGHGLLL